MAILIAVIKLDPFVNCDILKSPVHLIRSQDTNNLLKKIDHAWTKGAKV